MFQPAISQSIVFLIYLGGAVGIMTAVVAWVCPCGSAKIGDNAYFYGLPIALYGIVGYAALIALAWVNAHTASKVLLILFYVLSVGAVAVVPVLAYRSYQLAHFCPFCIMCWLYNIFIFGVACRHFFKDGINLFS